MKKIGILSDTHGYLDEAILNFLEDVDEIWHAGDIGSLKIADNLKSYKTLRAVYGNIDGQDVRLEYPLQQFFMCEKIPVFITHIGGYPGNYATGIMQKLLASPVKLFICGHSHILKVMFDKKLNLLHINPGAAGISGFHKLRTAVRLNIDADSIKDLEVLEISKAKSF